MNDYPPSLDDCAILVKEQYPNANGATWDGQNGNGHCYAELGQTSRNDDTFWTNVLFVSCDEDTDGDTSQSVSFSYELY